MRKLTALIVLGVLVPVVGYARQQALAPQDYVDIEQLYARYARSLDSGDASTFVQLFTADAVLVDENGTTHEGRARLEAVARDNPAKGVLHHVTAVRLEPSPEGVFGRAYVIMGRQGGQPGDATTFVGNGQYWDTIVRTPEGWRIKRREFRKPAAQGQPTATPGGRGGRGR